MASRATARGLLIRLLFLSLSPSLASAQELAEDSAATLFRDGRQAMKQGNYAEACAKFERSQRLDPAPGTIVNLAVCTQQLGQLLRARSFLEDFLRSNSRTDDRYVAVKELLSNLDERIPRLAIELLPDAPERVNIVLDGQELARAQWGTPVPVDPGVHTVIARAPGYRDVELSVQVVEGERAVRRIGRLLPVVPQFRTTKVRDSASPARPRPPDVPTHALSPLFYVATGIGVAGLLTTAASGAIVLSSRKTVDAHCVNKVCDAEGLSAAEQGRTFATVNTVALPIALAGASVATYLFVTNRGSERTRARPARVSVDSSFNAVMLKGTF